MSEKRDFKAAEKFFKSALKIAETPPEKVTTDKHGSYPRSIQEILGEKVTHRTNKYLNNLIEQSHREIKQRYGPMRCLGEFHSANYFCRAFDELKNFYKNTGDRNTKRTLAERRENYIEKNNSI